MNGLLAAEEALSAIKFAGKDFFWRRQPLRADNRAAGAFFMRTMRLLCHIVMSGVRSIGGFRHS